jgi:predicted  nucleic acid-binding Zn-ribbon protein
LDVWEYKSYQAKLEEILKILDGDGDSVLSWLQSEIKSSIVKKDTALDVIIWNLLTLCASSGASIEDQAKAIQNAKNEIKKYISELEAVKKKYETEKMSVQKSAKVSKFDVTIEWFDPKADIDTLKSSVKTNAEATRQSAEDLFKDDKYISLYRRTKSVVPWNEISWYEDAWEDSLNQSKKYVLEIIKSLEKSAEKKNGTLVLPGWWPGWTHTFKWGYREKLFYINKMLEKMQEAMDDKNRWVLLSLAHWMIGKAAYIAPFAIWAALVLYAWKKVGLGWLIKAPISWLKIAWKWAADKMKTRKDREADEHMRMQESELDTKIKDIKNDLNRRSKLPAADAEYITRAEYEKRLKKLEDVQRCKATYIKKLESSQIDAELLAISEWHTYWGIARETRAEIAAAAWVLDKGKALGRGWKGMLDKFRKKPIDRVAQEEMNRRLEEAKKVHQLDLWWDSFEFTSTYSTEVKELKRLYEEKVKLDQALRFHNKKEQIEGDIVTNGNDIATESGNVFAKKWELVAAKSNIENITRSIKNKNTDIRRIDTNMSKIASEDLRIVHMDSNIALKRGSLSVVQRDIAAKDLQISTETDAARKPSLIAERSALVTAEADINTEITRLIDQKTTILRQILLELNNQKDVMSAELETLEDNLAIANETKWRLEHELSELNSKVEALKTKKTALTESLRASEEAISSWSLKDMTKARITDRIIEVQTRYEWLVTAIEAKPWFTWAALSRAIDEISLKEILRRVAKK